MYRWPGSNARRRDKSKKLNESAMRFNITKRTTLRNYEGATAYALSPEMELYTAVATASLAGTFYEKADARLARLRELIARNDPAFVAKLAQYTRSQMHLRSVPLVLAVELARLQAGDGVVRKAVSGVVQRADEITELLAYYQAANRRSGPKKLNRLSKQVQKGLAEAFNRFDAYQFAKYDRDGDVKLRDALFLVHPRPASREQQAVFDQIAKGTLATPYTWETELSALGQQKFASEAEKRAATTAKWQELIESGKLGYMALLRNLRNIVQAKVSWDHMEKVCARLADAEAVAQAKQLPFRYLAAYNELLAVKEGSVPAVLAALEAALQASTANMRGFDGNTRVLIACDVSGSMQQPVSPRSVVQLYDVGLMLGMLMQNRCKHVTIGMFGESWKRVTLPGKNILANVNTLRRREGEVGYATNGYLVIRDLINHKEVVDKVLIFTDCQLWDSRHGGNDLQRYWADYKARIAPRARLYLFDLAGYGQAPVSQKATDVYTIAGWSDKVFDVLEAIENGQKAVDYIRQMNL